MRHQKPEIQLKVELNCLNVELLRHHVYLALADINIMGPRSPRKRVFVDVTAAAKPKHIWSQSKQCPSLAVPSSFRNRGALLG